MSVASTGAESRVLFPLSRDRSPPHPASYGPQFSMALGAPTNRAAPPAPADHSCQYGPRLRFGLQGTAFTSQIAACWTSYQSPSTTAGGGVGKAEDGRPSACRQPSAGVLR